MSTLCSPKRLFQTLPHSHFFPFVRFSFTIFGSHQHGRSSLVRNPAIGGPDYDPPVHWPFGASSLRENQQCMQKHRHPADLEDTRHKDQKAERTVHASRDTAGFEAEFWIRMRSPHRRGEHGGLQGYFHETENRTRRQRNHLYKPQETQRLWSSTTDSVFFIQKNLVGLVGQNPGLTELRISIRLFSLMMAIKEMICAIPTLRRLWVDTGLDRERIKLLLSVLPETVEDITFMVNSIYDEQTNVPKVEKGAMPSLPVLMMIAFKGCYEGVGNSVLLPHVRACTKLISFETTTIQPFCDESCRAVLANLRIFLERIDPLYLPKGDQSVDSEITTTISLSAGYMKGINLQHCKQTERLTVAAIMDNCEFLEYLNVCGDGYEPQSRSGARIFR